MKKVTFGVVGCYCIFYCPDSCLLEEKMRT